MISIYYIISVLALSLTQAHADVIQAPSDQGKYALQIRCGEGVSREACLRRYQVRIYIADLFQKNYTPELQKMLVVAAASAQMIDRIQSLKDRPDLQKKIMLTLQKHATDLEFQKASIKTEELGDYTLRVFAAVFKETAGFAADVVDSSPIAVLPSGTGAKMILQAVPHVMEVAETIVKELPKFEVIDGNVVAITDQQRSDTFTLVSKMTETNFYLNASPEIFAALNTPFATIFKEGREITDAKLASHPQVQQLAAINDLLTYQSGELTLTIHAAQNKISGEVLASAQGLTELIKRARTQVLAAAGQLMQGQMRLARGQADIIDGLDYLVQQQMKASAREKLRMASLEDVEKQIAKAESCQVKAQESNGQTRFSPTNLDERECAIDKSLLPESKAMLVALEYQEVLNISNNTVKVMGDLGVIFKNKELQKIANDSMKVIKTFEEAKKLIDAVEKLQNAEGLLTGLSGFMTGLGAITSAVSLFMDSGPSADELILEQLMELRREVQAMHAEMRQQFEAVNNKLDNLGSDINSAFLAQNRVISAELVDVLENQDAGFNKLLRKLQKLNVINQNIFQQFQDISYVQLESAINSYSYEINSVDIVQRFKNLMAEFNALMSYIDRAASPETSGHKFLLNYDGVFEDYTNLIEQRSSANRVSPDGKAMLLGMLSSIDSGIPTECSNSVFPYVHFANNLLRQLLPAVNSTYIEGNALRSRLDLALANSNKDHFNIKSDLSETLDTLRSLNQMAIQCIGVDDVHKEAPSELAVIKTLYRYFYSKMWAHMSNVRDRMKSEGERIRTQVRDTLAGNFKLNVGPANIFTGLINGESRGQLREGFVVDSQGGLKDLENADFAGAQFMKREWKETISLCAPDSVDNKDQTVKELPFPTATVNAIVKDPHLKLAMASGLIRWNWCFEVGGYDAKTATKEILLVAKQTSLDDKAAPKVEVKGVWTLKLPVPEALRKKAASAYEKTTFDGIVTDELLLGLPNYRSYPRPKETVSLVGDCKPSRQQRVADRVSACWSFQFGYLGDLNNPDGDGQSTKCEQRTFEIYEVHSVKCKRLTDVVIDVWNVAAVTSSQGWDATVAGMSCTEFNGAMLKHCSETAAQMQTVESYAKTTEPLALNSNLTYAMVRSFAGYLPKDNPDQDIKLQVKTGVEVFYLMLRNGYEKCYFAMLKGEKSCSPLNGLATIDTSNLTVDLSDLAMAYELLNQLPSTLFVAKADAIANHGRLMEMMSNFMSPLNMVMTAEVLFESGATEKSAQDLMNAIFFDNDRIFMMEIVPFLEMNYEFDRSLLIDPTLMQDLERLRDAI